MKGIVQLFLAVLMVLVMAPGFAGAAEQKSAIVVAGTGTCIPIVRLLAEEFQRLYPAVKISVPASIGSGGGIKAAADGAVDIGMVSRPLKSDEMAKGLVVRPFARTAIVFATSPYVPDRELSYGDILAIYRGEKKKWKDGRKIIVLTREASDSSVEVLRQKLPGFKELYDASQEKKVWTTLFTDQEMNQALVKTPGAFGITDQGAVITEKLAVKVLDLNGIAPLLDNVRSGKYPLSKPLAFVYRKEALSPASRAFLAFVFSPKGRMLLNKHGYLAE